MPLHKFKDFYPNYRETFGDTEIIHLDSYSLYTEGDNKVGSIKDMLVDDNGRFRYLIADTGFWIFGKKVLMPIGLVHFDYDNQRAYVDGLTQDQVENLPAYDDNMVVDERYENQVREAYRPLSTRRGNRQFLGEPYTAENGYYTNTNTAAATTNTAAYNYDREPAMYGMSVEDKHEPLKLYEERLVTHKQREKAGEVVVNKRVETDTARASVPVEKERVIVDRTKATTDQPATNANPSFQEGEVARMDVYEETADIDKEAYVREEVDVHKEVDRDTVTAEEKIRRERIDVDTKGNPNVGRNPSNRR